MGDPLDREAAVSDVTVVIPSIPPRRELLRRALDSVWAQSAPPAAVSVAIDYKHAGAAVTRNRALAGATTEWVAFLDDDDELYPHHLERLMTHAMVTGADVVWPWFDVIGGTDPFPMHEGREFDPTEPHAFPITALVRRELAVGVDGFPLERDPHNGHGGGEDWLFWLKLAEIDAKFAHLPERTWCWHHDSGNTGGLGSRW